MLPLSPLDAVVAALATWRISHMLLYENGPFRAIRRARVMLGVTYYDDGDVVASSKYEITTCIWCISVWVGAVVGALWLLAPMWTYWVVLPLALSACAVIVSRLMGTLK